MDRYFTRLSGLPSNARKRKRARTRIRGTVSGAAWCPHKERPHGGRQGRTRLPINAPMQTPRRLIRWR